MKPFNLEAAKAGAPVCTRDGESVRLLCFNRKTIGSDLSIVGLCLDKNNDVENVYYWDKKGQYLIGEETELDLFMASSKKEYWINVFESPAGILTIPYDSKETADMFVINSAGDERVACAHVEWED